MKISRWTFEGTVEEYQVIAPQLFEEAEDTSIQLDEPARPLREPVAVEIDDVSEVMRAVLRRMQIPNGQMALFRALYQAGDEGMSQESLAEAMNRTPDQLYGVLGAFGRRINSTPGIPLSNQKKPGIGFVLRAVWKDGQYRYWLKPEFRSVLEDEGLV
jgi:hypothetical protein